MGALVIEYRPLSDIRPDPGNARTHSGRQIKQLEASLREFGFVNPLLVDESYELIAGHGRLRAARNIGLTELPVIVIPGLSVAEKKTLRIADNKIALNAGWDTDLLRIELKAIAILDPKIDLTITGHTGVEIDLLTLEIVETSDDDAPAAANLMVTKPGDIWILDKHRLGCGDCSDFDFLGAVMDGSIADAAFLDAPYNVRIDGNAVGKGRHREFAVASGELSFPEFQTFLATALGALVKVSRDGAVHFVCMDHRHIEELAAASRHVYGERLNICVWNKSNGGMGSLYRSKHELVFVFKVGDAPYYNGVELGRYGRNRTNVWDYPSVNTFGSRRDDLDLHPTVKPAAMVADAIRDVTRAGEVVLDGFLGSGTTLIACERTGRICRAIELDPIYCDVAVRRWIDLTGLEATEAGSGETFAQRCARLEAAGHDD